MSSSQLEVLSNQFNSLLTQYQNTYQDFTNSSTSSFVSVPNTAYVGGTNLNVIQNSNINSCISSCESTASCSGATFSDAQNSCTLSSGTGNIISSTNQSAIVQQALYYSYQLQQLNQQLSSVNSSMMALSKSSQDSYNKNQTQTNANNAALEQNYNTLESERGEIEKIIKQYETLSTAYDSGTIYVTSYYYSYIMYFMVVIALMGVLFKFGLMDSSQIQRGGRKYPTTNLWIMVVLFAVSVYCMFRYG